MVSRGRVSCAVTQGTLDVVGTRLGNSCGGHVFITLVDGGLHLLQELVNVHQVSFGAQIAHGGQMVGLGRDGSGGLVATMAATDADHGRHGLVLWHCTTVGQRQREAMEVEQTLAYGGIGGRVELTALQVSKELIEGIVATLLALVGRLVGSIVANGIVDVSIRGIGLLLGVLRLVVLWWRVAVSLGDRTE